MTDQTTIAAITTFNTLFAERVRKMEDTLRSLDMRPTSRGVDFVLTGTDPDGQFHYCEANGWVEGSRTWKIKVYSGKHASPTAYFFDVVISFKVEFNDGGVSITLPKDKKR